MSPSEPSGSSSQALPDTEKEHLLARIQELEAAEHSEQPDWLTQTGLNKDDELRRSDSRAHPVVFPWQSVTHASCFETCGDLCLQFVCC